MSIIGKCACGTERTTAANGITLCPHCDTGTPPHPSGCSACRQYDRFLGSGPGSGS